jgi:hypothetical protein
MAHSLKPASLPGASDEIVLGSSGYVASNETMFESGWKADFSAVADYSSRSRDAIFFSSQLLRHNVSCCEPTL